VALQRLAHRKLSDWYGADTLSKSELVHEAFLKLARASDSSLEHREHLFRAASRAMREVLVDFARRKGASKRGGSWRAVSLSQAESALQVQVDRLVPLHTAHSHLYCAN